MKSNKFYDYNKLNKLLKTIYSIKIKHSINKKIKFIKNRLDKKSINSIVTFDTDSIYIIVGNINGYKTMLFYPIQTDAKEILFHTIEFYFSERRYL